MQACDYTFVSFTAGLVLVDPMRDAIADMTARADRAIADAIERVDFDEVAANVVRDTLRRIDWSDEIDRDEVRSIVDDALEDALGDIDWSDHVDRDSIGEVVDEVASDARSECEAEINGMVERAIEDVDGSINALVAEAVRKHVEAIDINSEVLRATLARAFAAALVTVKTTT